ncbi:MAG: hypothetical protein PHD61_08005 [Bacteroidales bacterium]|nr:hypothetical protein [Lentimicrobiaceae bacterium]MDD5695234.1 hypothetical protein [Bacteroidales bacterium]
MNAMFDFFRLLDNPFITLYLQFTEAFDLKKYPQYQHDVKVVDDSLDYNSIERTFTWISEDSGIITPLEDFRRFAIRRIKEITKETQVKVRIEILELGSYD